MKVDWKTSDFQQSVDYRIDPFMLANLDVDSHDGLRFAGCLREADDIPFTVLEI